MLLADGSRVGLGNDSVTDFLDDFGGEVFADRAACVIETSTSRKGFVNCASSDRAFDWEVVHASRSPVEREMGECAPKIPTA